MTEDHPAVRPDALVVWPPVGEDRGHAPHQLLVRLLGRTEVEDAGDATHSADPRRRRAGPGSHRSLTGTDTLLEELVEPDAVRPIVELGSRDRTTASAYLRGFF